MKLAAKIACMVALLPSWQNTTYGDPRKFGIRAQRNHSIYRLVCPPLPTHETNLTAPFFFSLSIQSLRTNVKGLYKMGDFYERHIGDVTGLDMKKGERVGNFNLGSSIVLVFEAPDNFEFEVEPGQVVKHGQPLGRCIKSQLQDGG